MFKILLLFAGCMFVAPFCNAQSEFCEAVTAILRDAPNQFRNVRTHLTETGYALKAFKTGIHVPGAIKERFVESRGIFYEGAIYQTNIKDSLKPHYEALGRHVEACLADTHFKKSVRIGFDPRVADCPKIVFLPPFDGNSTVKALKGHIAIEADYNKNNGLYTLELFIFEH